jgi:hypothetical protein
VEDKLSIESLFKMDGTSYSGSGLLFTTDYRFMIYIEILVSKFSVVCRSGWVSHATFFEPSLDGFVLKQSKLVKLLLCV